MSMHRPQTRSTLFSTLVFALVGVLFAQQTALADVDKAPDRGFSAGKSYSISDIETISVQTGNVMFGIPAGTLPAGRGGLSAGVTLFYNSKLWDAKASQTFQYNGDEIEANVLGLSPEGGWHYGYKYYITTEVAGNKHRYLLVGPDGARHLLLPGTGTSGIGDETGAVDNDFFDASPSRWFTTDNTFLRVEVADGSTGSWTVYLPDGSRIVNNPAAGIAQRRYDRNGNRIDVIETGSDPDYSNRKTTCIKDELGRNVVIEYDTGTDDVDQDTVHSPGFGGADLQTRIVWKSIRVNRVYIYAEGIPAPPQTGYDWTHYPLDKTIRVVDEVYLPTVSSFDPYYEFSYNADATSATDTGWGEVSEVRTPAGATSTYAYQYESSGGTPDEIMRNGVVTKTLTYDLQYDGSTTPHSDTWTYARIGSEANGSGPAVSASVTGPDGGVTTEYYKDTTVSTVVEIKGETVKIVNPDGSVVERVYATDSPGAPANAGVPNPMLSANRYVKYEIVTIANAAGAPSKTSFKEYSRDKNGNTTEVREYDFADTASISIPRDSNGFATGLPSNVSGYLKRVTRTEYHNETPDAASGTYTDEDSYHVSSSPRLLNLVKSVEVQDASGTPKFRSEMSYDYTSYSTNSVAGNVTESRSWDSFKGGQTRAYSNPLTSTNSVATSATYNSYGMPLTTTDANGVVTQITYGNVTGPNGNVTDLYPTQTVAAYGTAAARTSSAVYDFYTGLATSTTDEDNHLTTATEYDGLGRPTKSIVAPGNAIYESWTAIEYHDADRFVVTRSDLEAKGDGRKVAIQHYDQLGRVRLSRSLEDAATQNPLNETDGIKVQTQYKTVSGYTYQLTSNPYRAASSSAASGEETMGWTLSTALSTGRHSEVQTFAGAALPSAFGGNNANSTGTVKTDVDANATTVTDQAGRVRRSVTNALGWLTRVDEPTSAGLGAVSGPNQPTSYTYDVLNNLLTVTQAGSGTEQCGPAGGACTQARSFTYSSLSRLMSATNPESGTISYGYDPNGNLLNKTDARGVVTEYVYDPLNRVTNRNYSTPNGTPGTGTLANYQATPNVTYTYGTAAPAIGKLTKVSSSVSTTEYTSFDILGRVTAHKQTTDGGDPVGYTTAYAYNLAGALIEETYPSGRVVKNVLDQNGDLSIVKSKKDASHLYWNYAQNFTYSAAGAVTSMQLGNGRWESTVFNSRLQPTQIALGTTVGAFDLLKLNYDYGDWSTVGTIDAAKNNGNIVQQTIAVPNSPGHTDAFEAVQKYYYDPLNRIDDATEDVTPNGGTASQTWRQDFQYDRYGNRSLNETNTTTIPRQCGTSPSLTVCTADRQKYNPAADPGSNKLSSGQGYSYDASGNTTADPRSMTFTYDGENKQVEVRDPSIPTAGDPDANLIGRYWYDGDGRRVKKYAPPRGSDPGETTVFVYDAGGKLVAEYSTSVATQTQAKVSYLTNDHLGSPRINTDASGAVISRHDYHPFGEEISTTQRINHPEYAGDRVRKQFTGYERDKETELDFAQARYYNSQLARFVIVDPLLSSARVSDARTWNRYSYVLNNPLNFIDPKGLYECGASLSTKNCEKFEKTRIDLEKARDYFQKKGDTQKADALNKALTAIGTAGDKNGLTIEIGKVKKGAAAETSFGKDSAGNPLLAKEIDGKTVANVVLTFKSEGEINLENLAHEGSHTEDHQNFIAAMFAATAKNPLVTDEQIKNLPENFTKYVTESKAYHVSSYIEEYNGTADTFWNKGWREVDRQEAIDRHLNSSDLYKITPKQQGRRLYETTPKQ